MTDFTKIATAAEAYKVLNTTREEVTDYFLRVEKVMHFLIDRVGFDPKWSKRYWCSGINPYYDQLDLSQSELTGYLGLVIVDYYGDPNRLATPFGGITFGHGGIRHYGWYNRVKELGIEPAFGDNVYSLKSGENVGQWKELESEDDLQGVYNQDGVFGPAWSVKNDCDGTQFCRSFYNPDYIGIPAMSHGNSFSYEVCKEVWGECQPEGFRTANEKLREEISGD